MAWVIILSFLFVHSQHKELTLAESMAETKKEQQKMESLLTEIQQSLEHQNYDEVGLSFSFQEHLLTVQVKDQAFLDQNEKKIKALINDIAKEKKIDSFKIQLESLETYHAISEEDKKLNDLVNEVSKIVSESLHEKGYYINAMMIDPRTPNPSIEIRIEETEEYYDKVKDDIQQLVSNAVFSKTKINFQVKITRKSENDIRDEKWQPIFSTIREETEKKFEEYEGFAYSFHPEPLQIIIKTDLQKSKWPWNSNKKAKQIVKYVDEIIELKREELSVEVLPYKVIIRGKNNKQVNESSVRN
ncbi:hypothetical protein [Psychrobacillus sp. NPDC096389]|uniref:hypothetical protein n=1 Tax=Psychrobacillus sp. NPDC096389 TaxID=3364490 RepID=UPI003823690C